MTTYNVTIEFDHKTGKGWKEYSQAVAPNSVEALDKAVAQCRRWNGAIEIVSTTVTNVVDIAPKG